MHQLLIIDDQTVLADDLADMLPWSDIGVDVVHKAYSGREALELMYEHSIDVVVTDIRMPGMSGLELIAEIKKNWKHVKCILLTGYADFEYTKQALQLRSSDYLLKPVEDEELMQAVRNALNELEKEWLEISSVQKTMYALREQLPKLREYLLLDLITGKQPAEAASLEKKLKRYEVPFRSGSECRMMMMRIDNNTGIYDAEDEALIQYALTNMAAELFGDRMRLWSCTEANGFIVCVLTPKAAKGFAAASMAAPPTTAPTAVPAATAAAATTPATTPASTPATASSAPAASANAGAHAAAPGKSDGGAGKLAEEFDIWMESQAFQLQQAAKSYLKIGISVLTSKSGIFPNDVAMMYQSSLAGFRQFIGSDNELFVSLAKEPDRGEPRLLSELYRSPNLVNLMEMGQWDGVDEKLESIFLELEEEWPGSQEHVIETYFVIASSLASMIHRTKKWLADTIGDDFYAFVNGQPISSVGELRQWTRRVIDNYRRSISDVEKDSRSSIIRKVQEFIEQNLDSASLQSISANVFLNPSYLSKIYKLETGEGISEYILRVRMEKAAVLLSQSPEKIYEISVMLGYHKPSYFIQLFKKHFGVTPQEYRNKIGV